MSAPSEVRARRTIEPSERATRGAFLALGAAAGSWGSRIPDVKEDLGLSDGALASALLGLSIGAVAGSWLGGLLVRRFGSRRVIGGSWVAVGLMLASPGLAHSWRWLAVAALVVGLAIGVLDVSMNGAGIQLEHAAGEPLLNGLHARWSAGVLLGAGVGSLAVAAHIHTAAHLAGAGLVLAVSALFAWRQLPDGTIATAGLADVDPLTVDPRTVDPPDDPPEEEPANPGTGGRRLVALAAIGGFVFLGEGALMDWSGVFVRDVLDGGALLGALAVTGLSAGGLAGRLVGDRLAARWSPPVLVGRGVVLAAVALAAVLTTPVAASVPILLAVVGVGISPAVPLAFAAAGHRWGERGIAVVTTAGYGCYLAAPAVIGGIAHTWSLRLALLVPLVLVVAVIPLAWSTTVDER